MTLESTSDAAGGAISILDPVTLAADATLDSAGADLDLGPVTRPTASP
ncbi:MAG: hypothetical protein U5R48_14870 [Gammaproteobacteria bacterium]|nr:hypothetical protein [Gammaproteobacteria bacterium]